MKKQERAYSTHSDYVARVAESAARRQRDVESALREAFSEFLTVKETDIVLFASMTPRDLASAFMAQPSVVKPVLAICNVAARAVERDLGFRNLNTYAPRLSHAMALAIAAYVKPFLPEEVAISALSHLDRVNFLDKEVRMHKGRWEKQVIAAVERTSGRQFRKRMFVVGGERFELDAAHPAEGDITVGIDVKRIEARRDIHKRSDEIVNKGARLKARFPSVKFGAVIYYPFVAEHANVQNRLNSPAIDAVVFAAETRESIDTAVRLLLAKLGVHP